MVKKITAAYHAGIFPDDIRADFSNELFFTNFMRGRIFSIVLFFVFVILAITDLFNKSKGMWNQPGYAELFYVHSVTAAMLAVSTIGFFIFPPKSAFAIRARHKINVITFALFMMFSGIATSFVDQYIHGQISAYIIMAFGLGAVLYMRHAASILLYAISITLFVIGIKYVQHDPTQLAGHYINGTTLTLVAWLLSRVVYTGFKKNYIHRKTIEKQAESIRRQSELNSGLIGSLISVSHQLNTSFGDLESNSDGLMKNLKNQASSLEEMTATTEEVAAGSENVTISVVEQHASMAELMQKLDELASVTREMESMITSTLEKTGDISGKAKSGERYISTMNDTMVEISTTSREMANILTIINDISDRINLLSLNASIEAARAGDSGRGFAVVADEIGKLADQTSSSVKEIDTLIKKSETEIGKGLSGVRDTVSAISGIISGVSEIDVMINSIDECMRKNISFNEIVYRNAENTKTRSDEIKSASEGQKNATHEIVRAITDINQYSQLNALNAEGLLQLSRQIATMAQHIKEKISIFQTEGEKSAHLPAS